VERLLTLVLAGNWLILVSDIYLVTTPIERTWPKDKPVLFLGEWCRLYNRRSYWGTLEQQVADYHWNDREKYKEDYRYLSDVHEVLLEEIKTQLNSIHNVDYSIRYWRILIGPWLIFFVQSLYDRWSMLNTAINKYNPDACNILDRNIADFIPYNMVDFGGKATKDDWNEAIYSQLLKVFFSDKIKIKHIAIEENKTEHNYCAVHKSSLKSIVFNTLFGITNHIYHNSEYFFIDSLMPRKLDLKIQFKLKQFPKIWRHPTVPLVSPDMNKRNWNLNLPDEEFYNVLSYMIPRHIPLIHIEGYESLSSHLDTIHWPNSPKAIVTGNTFKHESTNMWIARKTEEGVPLIVRQHGGVYGICSFSAFEDHEISIADYWLSWGWTIAKNDKVIPFGGYKHSGASRINYDSRGGVLIVGVSTVRYSCEMLSVPIAGQWLSYFDNQVKFVDSLPETIRTHVTVRLMRIDHGVCQKARWMDSFDDISIDEGNGPIKPLIESSRIYISTYNATTFLESLSWNIPTIIFWDTRNNELNSNADYDFNLLRSVGIFHDSPESAARHLTRIWDNIPLWWDEKKVQDVRRDFCWKYNRTYKDSVGSFVSQIEALL